jgi:hypothetical protein
MGMWNNRDLIFKHSIIDKGFAIVDRKKVLSTDAIYPLDPNRSIFIGSNNGTWESELSPFLSGPSIGIDCSLRERVRKDLLFSFLHLNFIRLIK